MKPFLFPSISSANVVVVVPALGRRVHQSGINGIRNMRMIVGAPTSEFDSQRTAIVADGANRGRTNWCHAHAYLLALTVASMSGVKNTGARGVNVIPVIKSQLVWPYQTLGE